MTQLGFLQDHLLCWIDDFTDTIIDNASTPFFRCIAQAIHTGDPRVYERQLCSYKGTVMALFFVKPVEHAIRALIYLAVQEENRFVPVAEISDVEGIPSTHLSKIMKTLTSKKIVKSVRGPSGGVMLAKVPHDITVWDLVRCLGKEESFEECALGWNRCCDEDPCPLHEKWTELRDQNKRYLQNTTISDLAVIAIHKNRDKYPQFFTI